MGMGRSQVYEILVALLVVMGAELPVSATPSESAALIAQEVEPDNVAIEQAEALNEQVLQLYEDGKYGDALPLAE